MGWSANKSRLALAMVASSSVCADRRRSAGIRKALVQIHAFGTDGLEAILTEALSFDALSIVDAIEIRFAESCHVGLKMMHDRMTLYRSVFIILVASGDIVLGNENRSRPPYIRLFSRRANKKRAFIINNAMSQFCGFTNDENSLEKR